MALRVRYPAAPGQTLTASVERLADRAWLDFADTKFRPAPARPRVTLAEGTGNYRGLYRLDLAETPEAEFRDGDYSLYVHLTTTGKGGTTTVLDVLSLAMFDGDDATPLGP